MKRTFYFLSLFLLLAMQAGAYKKESIDIQVNNKTRNMVVFTPNSLPAKSPLFIVTHGMNQDPEYQYGLMRWLLVLTSTENACTGRDSPWDRC